MDTKLKSEIKKLTYAEVGAKLDDMRESCERDVYRYEGAITALKEATGRTADLCAHVDKDFDAGQIKDDLPANDVRALIKRWLMRASGVCENLKDGAVTRQLQSTGKVASLEQSVAFVKNLFDTEDKKVKALAALQAGAIPTLQSAPTQDDTNVVPIDRPRKRARLEGTHPGDSLAAQRKAERQATAEAEPDAQRIEASSAEVQGAKKAAQQTPEAPDIERIDGQPASATAKGPLIARPTAPTFGSLPQPQLDAGAPNEQAQAKKVRAKKGGRKIKA